MQRVSSSVTEACNTVSSILRTEIPDLIRPWFATDHDQISTPLFIDVTLKGVVFCTDDSGQQLFFFRQTPIPRKIFILSKGYLDNKHDPVPKAPKLVKSIKAKWKSIAGLCRVKYICFVANKETSREALLVADKELGTIRCFNSSLELWRRPITELDCHTVEVCNLNEAGFSPFSLRASSENDSIVFITDPNHSCIYLAEISKDASLMRLRRKIDHGVLKRPIDCLYLSHALFVTDAWAGNPAIHVFDINTECGKDVRTITNSQFTFLFGICKNINGNVLSPI